MSEYGGNDRRVPFDRPYAHWLLLLSGMFAAALLYTVLPDRAPGPNSATVIGVTAPHPAFGSYPGFRVPVIRVATN